MSTPRVGVIGAGSLGYHHVRLLRDMPNAEFAGFYDIDATRAAAVQAELGAIAAPSLTALLDRVDAVTVVVPTPAHHAVAKQALSRGVHVLIEKPITTSLDDSVGDVPHTLLAAAYWEATPGAIWALYEASIGPPGVGL